MQRLKRVLVLFLLTGSVLIAKDPPPVDVPIPFVRLLATPERYDGKRVTVYAQVLVTYEGQGAFASRESATHPSNGVCLDGDLSRYVLRDKELWYQGRITGIFRAGKRGQAGTWSGTIEKLSRIEIERLPDDATGKQPESKGVVPPAVGAPVPSFPGAVKPPSTQ